MKAVAALAFLAGLALGALSVYLAPVYGLRATHAALTKAEGAAASQEARGDQSEANRKTEADTAVTATETTRAACDDRIAARERVLEARLAACLQEEPEPDESCPCAAHGPLRAYSDWVREPQLDERRPGVAGSAEP